MKPMVRLIQFSDMHLFGDANGRLRGVATLPALQAAVRDAQQRGDRADAVLLTGDLVQDDPAGYRWIRSVFGASQVPVLCLPGNHDLPDPMRAALQSPPFTIGGSMQFADWLVVMLDTWAPNQAGGRLGEEQIRRLRTTLAEHSEQHVLVCLHHHPIPMDSRWLDEVGLSDAGEFMAAVREHSNVRGVLWGHVHQALDLTIDGVRFMSSPATCAQFLPRSDKFAVDDRPPGYRVLDLHADGAIDTEVRWLENYAAATEKRLAVGG